MTRFFHKAAAQGHKGYVKKRRSKKDRQRKGSGEDGRRKKVKQKEVVKRLEA